MFRGILLFLSGVWLLGAPVCAHAQALAPVYDQSAAVILVYQRIGEATDPDTSLSKEQFADHMHELLRGGYNIAPLGTVVAALKAGNPLPARTVAITFDGAYKSALENAIPLLLEKKVPFTVFFAPGQADAKDPDYMSWDDLRALARSKLVTLGLHTLAYTRIADRPEVAIRQQVNGALARYRAELGTEPLYFAYPFGEYSKAYRAVVAASGFEAAFGQQSGVAYAGADLFALPRFTMTGNYADMSRFLMVASALPLPVSDITPDDPHITGENPPALGFSVDETLAGKLKALSCFVTGQGKPAMQIVGKARVELRVEKPLGDGRVRLNCTMPGPKPKPGDAQRWRWFGLLLTVGQQGDGSNADSQDAPSPAVGPDGE